MNTQLAFLNIQPGFTEIVFICAVILMLFGSKNVPKIARKIGSTFEDLRRATRDVKNEIMYADYHEEEHDQDYLALEEGDHDPYDADDFHHDHDHDHYHDDYQDDIDQDHSDHDADIDADSGETIPRSAAPGAPPSQPLESVKSDAVIDGAALAMEVKEASDEHENAIAEISDNKRDEVQVSPPRPLTSSDAEPAAHGDEEAEESTGEAPPKKDAD